MNQVSLVGRLTKDPVLRQLSQGRMQTSFVLAINRSFKNLKGEIDTDYVLCTLWGRTAENTAKHCGKGSMVGVSGRIQSRTYERADGGRVYVTEVIGEDVRFLITKKRTDQLFGDNSQAQSDSASSAEAEEKAHFDLVEPEMEELPIY